MPSFLKKIHHDFDLQNANKIVGVASVAFADGSLLNTVTVAFATLTDGATISWDTQSRIVVNATVTLAGNRTLAMTNLVSGATGVLVVKQDSTGSRTLTLPTGSKIVGGGGTAAGLSTAANSVDVFAWIYDGTSLIWTRGLGAA